MLTAAQADLAAVHHHLAQHEAMRAKRRWPWADPSDLDSDAMLGLVEAAACWDGRDQFGAFARVVIRRTMANAWRERNGRYGHKVTALLPTDDEGQALDRFLATDDLGFERVTDAVVAAATVAGLDLSDRNLAILVELGTGRTLQDVAAQFGVTESRVSQIRRYAFERLPANAWRRRCEYCDGVLTGIQRRYDTDRCRKRAYNERRRQKEVA